MSTSTSGLSTSALTMSWLLTTATLILAPTVPLAE